MATVDKKVIAALVSINYSDFLELVLPFNTKIFDTIYVITTREDKKCIDICSQYNNVNCFIVENDTVKKHGNFNKGAIYNKFFDFLNNQDFNDWICLTDSDIIFPPNFRELICDDLDPNNIYSLSRAFCQNENQFKRYLSHINSGQSHNDGVDRRCGPSVTCIGYMQLFKFNNEIKMSESCGHAGKSDHWFVRDFFKQKNFKCMNLKEGAYCVHLGRTGTNWNGRHSSIWNLDDKS